MQKINGDDIDTAVEQRADYIEENELLQHTAHNGLFDNIVSLLLKRQTTLIVGPRGCGKTHMMRFAALQCKTDQSKPLAIYVSFNRYYRLEPMLGLRVNAIGLFHSWVLSRVLLATLDVIQDNGIEVTNPDFTSFTNAEYIKSIVARLERASPLTAEDESLLETLTVYRLIEFIEDVCISSERTRCILLMDDAALTLTPEYMKEFFDIFRILKTPKISAKASVYPGTTEYGARFHPTQEGGFESVWLSVESPNYSKDMESIALTRISDYASIPEDVREYFKYAAFGVPRAFLFMIQAYLSDKNKRNKQQVINGIVQLHYLSRIDEFNSISVKSPKLKSLIEIGRTAFTNIVDLLKLENLKQLPLGMNQFRFGLEEVKDLPLVKRMFNLLVEAGLLFEFSEKVSHGSNRTYTRYIPHFSALFHEKVFTSGDKGWSSKVILDRIAYPSVKQPLRRKITTLLSKSDLEALKLDLPACAVCGADRLNTSQKFCHLCGNELIDKSTFEACLTIPLYKVPGLTIWQREKIQAELPKFKTIGDFLSTQDPGAELRQVNRFGKVKATKITQIVLAYVDEFLQ